MSNRMGVKKFIQIYRFVASASVLFFAMAFLLSQSSTEALAHNQAPATIKRAMEKAFDSLKAPLPKNIYKGDKQIKVAGTTAQVFVAKTGSGAEQKTVGVVVQLEVSEKTNVVAYSAENGETLAVVKDGASIAAPEWSTLPFVEEIRSKLFTKKKE